jgi:hypothetical protein
MIWLPADMVHVSVELVARSELGLARSELGLARSELGLARSELGLAARGTDAVPAGNASDLHSGMQGDLFKPHVTVLGSNSSKTQIGGKTTAPMLRVNSIHVTGKRQLARDVRGESAGGRVA